jgi:hypothetical protein
VSSAAQLDELLPMTALRLAPDQQARLDEVSAPSLVASS